MIELKRNENSKTVVIKKETIKTVAKSNTPRKTWFL